MRKAVIYFDRDDTLSRLIICQMRTEGIEVIVTPNGGLAGKEFFFNLRDHKNQPQVGLIIVGVEPNWSEAFEFAVNRAQLCDWDPKRVLVLSGDFQMNAAAREHGFHFLLKADKTLGDRVTAIARALTAVTVVQNATEGPSGFELAAATA